MGLGAQELKITYDFESVEKMIEIFEKGNLYESDFKALLELQGTQAYLKKLSTFFDDIDAHTFRESLKAAISGTILENNPFSLDKVIDHIAPAKELINEINKDKKYLENVATEILKKYIPQSIKMEVKVIAIMGVIGGGWTTIEKPDTFYVDLTSMRGDKLGLSYLAIHEIYHLIQEQFMNQTLEQTEGNGGLYILNLLLREGSAVYVADFSKIDGGGYYVDFSKKEYAKNFRRMKSNFALFEMLLQQASSNTSISIDNLYFIGFSGMYQSPLYYVGYHMMQLIEKYCGKKELISLLKNQPAELILAYNELSIKYKKADGNFIPLSNLTVKILESIRK